MKKCPRCYQMTMWNYDTRNKLSRRDNKTYICNECGEDEGLIDLGVRWAGKLERDFVAKVDKKGR